MTNATRPPFPTFERTDRNLFRGCITFMLMRYRHNYVYTGAAGLLVKHPETGEMVNSRSLSPVLQAMYMMKLYDHSPRLLAPAIMAERTAGTIKPGLSAWEWSEAALKYLREASTIPHVDDD